MSKQPPEAALRSLPKEELEKIKLEAEITNLKRGRITAVAQSATLLLAVIALLLNGVTASFDRRQAVLDRDSAKLQLQKSQDELVKVKGQLEDAQAELELAKRRVETAGGALADTMTAATAAASPEVRQFLMQAWSPEQVLNDMKRFIDLLAEGVAPAPARDNWVRGINNSVAIFPDIKDKLIAYSDEVELDPQIWLSPKYTTTEEESANFMLEMSIAAAKERGEIPNDAETINIYPPEKVAPRKKKASASATDSKSDGDTEGSR